MPYRSFLFAPGNHPRKVEKVFDCGADAVILDLEDAVANAEKLATRPAVVEALKCPRPNKGYVRINAHHTEFCYGDLVEVVGPWLDGIVLPMVETPDQLQSVDWLIGNLEAEAGMDKGTIDLIPIIETGKGIAGLDAIAAAGAVGRVRRMAFGAGDYTHDMNIGWSVDEGELAHAREAMVLYSRANDLDPPLDTVWIHIKDLENLENSAATARRMGFQGKMCIYPPQVEVVNRVFTPDAEEVEFAKKIVSAFEEAEKQGSSSIQLDGYFIDYPIVYKAQRTLEIMAEIEG